MPAPTYKTAGNIHSIPGTAWWVVEVTFTNSYKSYKYLLATSSGYNSTQVASIVKEVWVDSPHNGWARVKVVSVRAATTQDCHKLASLNKLAYAKPAAKLPQYIPSDFDWRQPVSFDPETYAIKSAATMTAAKDAVVLQKLQEFVKCNLNKKEIANMNIKVTTPTLLNGRELSSYSNTELFALISSVEKEIENLEKIKARPAALIKEIEDKTAAVAALVAAMDAQGK